jgi:hypothetical protein
MASDPLIQSTGLKTLSNIHGTFRQSIRDLFNIANGDTGSIMERYRATTAAIQSLLGRAVLQDRTVRALGANWSFTKAGYTSDWILSTGRLNMMKRILPEEVFDPSTYELDRLLFAQCGCAVQELSKALRPLGRSLKTSGASNGQTIVGAISTGTHGSAFDFGAIQDFIVGLHIITGPGKHVYLERASAPVVSGLFVQKTGAELVRDDNLFHAALVSFGSFGFIHGVMLETEPLYLLNAYRTRIGLDQIGELMQTLDFSDTPFLPLGNERPFHFQVLVNPYDLQNGAYVTTMYKRPYRNDYHPPVIDYRKAGPGEDAPGFLGRLTRGIPGVTHLVVNKIIGSAYAPYSDAWGTLNEIFYNTDAQGRVLSAAIGIPLEESLRVNRLLLRLNETQGPFVGILAYRFVKSSNALLGFTRYGPVTCVAEFDSVESPNTRQFYEAIWQELDQAGIPYSFHWGKINNLDAMKVSKIYGPARIEWMEARSEILPAESLQIFTNQTLTDWGLDQTPPFIA